MKKRDFAVFDFETDPFKEERVPKPFCVGVYDGSTLWKYWGEDCVEKFLAYIADRPKTIFYAHNGGKFDFHFLLKYFRGDIRIVNRRILKAQIDQHEFRDSYGILPVPLAKFNKDEIDYKKFERAVRQKHKAEILHYMGNDCIYLYDAIQVFVDEFQGARGIPLTMAGAAMTALKKFHDFDIMDGATDKQIRPFYFGGRNQCFKTGIIKGDFTIYDVNSMYPHTMKAFQHPIGLPSDYGNTRINKKTAFAKVIGRNSGALPQRMVDGSLSFVGEYGEFYATIHELEAAEETGTFKIEKVIYTIEFEKWGNFAEFVDHFFGKRMKAAQIEGKDGAHVTLYKLILNGAYGKFAQNPEKFMDYVITENEIPEGADWLPADEIYDYIIWERPTERLLDNSWFNVATGASITGASRSLLLRGIAASDTPLYCDTDSIICRKLNKPNGSALGEWKIEALADCIAIAGKKTYAAFIKGNEVKKASKGVRLTGNQIKAIAEGEDIEYANPVPNFRLHIGGPLRNKPTDGRTRFVTRKIKVTA